MYFYLSRWLPRRPLWQPRNVQLVRPCSLFWFALFIIFLVPQQCPPIHWYVHIVRPRGNYVTHAV